MLAFISTARNVHTSKIHYISCMSFKKCSGEWEVGEGRCINKHR